jgi:hypothetical protein
MLNTEKQVSPVKILIESIRQCASDSVNSTVDLEMLNTALSRVFHDMSIEQAEACFQKALHVLWLIDKYRFLQPQEKLYDTDTIQILKRCRNKEQNDDL